ncbi:MAG: beta-glucosidase [Arcicella sp.]|nr:beta-glucosidase [Arcicella sp.]
MKNILLFLTIFALFFSCKKTEEISIIPEPFYFTGVLIDGKMGINYVDISLKPIIKISFIAPVNRASANANIILLENTTSKNIPLDFSFDKNDSTVIITSKSALNSISKYSLQVLPDFLSKANTKLNSNIQLNLTTAADNSDKFPIISDSLLLDLVQRQTFKYFWDFGHPVSGMSRERNTSGDLVTSGGTGFGIMAIIVGVERKFITRKQGLDRLNIMTDFLKNSAVKYHGAFPHWLNGATGATIPFSTKDDGADLVETSYLIQGLLTARQYFNGNDANEINLKNKINDLWNAVEWNWFTKNNENTLYWHWSPKYNWDMNFKLSGWNEALITYVLAESSPNFFISKTVYDEGWARNGQMKNGKQFYGITLPLGSDLGGPLFFAHYSFLGINPNGLTDSYANYGTQNVAHSLINYNYCKANPKKFSGYSENCWGLTASDEKNGYSAHEPNNDNGTISPTAALSSMPYTPKESMQALRFFYYKLGDKIWKNYGFVDAFNLTDIWFADSFLAIDQGPIIIMIENHRSQLLWKLFMSCPEVKSGMKKTGFTSPNL